MDIVNGKELKRLDYKGSSLLLTSSNDDYLVTNMGRVVVVFDLHKVEQRLVHQVKVLPTKVLFSRDPDCLFMMYAEKEILKVKQYFSTLACVKINRFWIVLRFNKSKCSGLNTF